VNPTDTKCVWTELVKAEEALRQATTLVSKRHALDRLRETLAQYSHLRLTAKPDMTSSHKGIIRNLRRNSL